MKVHTIRIRRWASVADSVAVGIPSETPISSHRAIGITRRTWVTNPVGIVVPIDTPISSTFTIGIGRRTRVASPIAVVVGQFAPIPPVIFFSAPQMVSGKTSIVDTNTRRVIQASKHRYEQQSRNNRKIAHFGPPQIMNTNSPPQCFCLKDKMKRIIDLNSRPSSIAGSQDGSTSGGFEARFRVHRMGGPNPERIEWTRLFGFLFSFSPHFRGNVIPIKANPCSKVKRIFTGGV